MLGYLIKLLRDSQHGQRKYPVVVKAEVKPSFFTLMSSFSRSFLSVTKPVWYSAILWPYWQGAGTLIEPDQLEYV